MFDSSREDVHNKFIDLELKVLCVMCFDFDFDFATPLAFI